MADPVISLILMRRIDFQLVDAFVRLLARFLASCNALGYFPNSRSVLSVFAFEVVNARLYIANVRGERTPALTVVILRAFGLANNRYERDSRRYKSRARGYGGDKGRCHFSFTQ